MQTEAKPRVRVFLIDDHPLFLQGIAAVLSSDPRFHCVGEAPDAPAALAALVTLEADVAVVDLSLRQGNGLDLLRALKALRPNLQSLVLSMHEEDLYAERALRAGANGYLMKDAPPERLRDAVYRVAAGEIVVSERVNTALVRRAIHGQAVAGDLAALSDRELEVFHLIGRGRSTREIAQALFLSVKTIETHRANIKHKLSIVQSHELVRAAVAAVEAAAPKPTKA